MTSSRTSSASRMRWSSAAFLLGALVMPACSSDPETPTTEPSGSTSADGEPDDASITIVDFGFGDPVVVDPGSVVRVVNADGVAHTVTADDGTFDTGIVEAGASTELTMDESGEFSFVCSIHSAMAGSITVTD